MNAEKSSGLGFRENNLTCGSMHRAGKVACFLVAVFASGCALSTEVPNPMEPPTPARLMPPSVEPVPPVEPVEPVEPPSTVVIEDCAASCEARASDSGFCQFNQHPSSGECVTRCEEARRQSAAVQEAFLFCLETDPLCFSSIGQCLLGVVHPSEVEVGVTVTGAELIGHDGRLVQGAVRVGAADYSLASDVIRDGGFELLFFERAVNGAVLERQMVHMYIDTDGNERCDAGVDLVGAVTLSHDGNFDEPSFSAALERDFLVADFVRCDLHND